MAADRPVTRPDHCAACKSRLFRAHCANRGCPWIRCSGCGAVTAWVLGRLQARGGTAQQRCHRPPDDVPMLILTCDGCAAVGYADCTCPEGYDPHTAGHLPGCAMGNLGAQVVCKPAAGCCQDGHDHDAAANACPGGHPEGSCPAPSSCKLWANVRSHHEDPDGAGLPASCPGGHCGAGVPGCTVCRPITVMVPPGHVGALKRAVA